MLVHFINYLLELETDMSQPHKHQQMHQSHVFYILCATLSLHSIRPSPIFEQVACNITYKSLIKFKTAGFVQKILASLDILCKQYSRAGKTVIAVDVLEWVFWDLSVAAC